MEDIATIDQVLKDVKELPSEWHKSGSLHPLVMEKIVEIGKRVQIKCSAETGTGKSTLLFSHLSENHTVFAQDDLGNGDSLQTTMRSPLLRKDRVSFIVGPTQRTLPTWKSQDSLQLAMIDGPHGFPFPQLEYFCLYPRIEKGGFLILDDIEIPTIFQMYQILLEDEMFHLEALVRTTAFLRRTDAPTFDPCGDGWWNQNYNKTRFPMITSEMKLGVGGRLRLFLPPGVKRVLKKLLRIR